MKKKMIDEMKTTSNSSVYRKAYKHIISNRNGKCGWCGWHSGENACKRVPVRSWKFRTRKKHQYEVWKSPKKVVTNIVYGKMYPSEFYKWKLEWLKK